MKKRGAYFFVLDALLGGAIFLISIVMIMGSYLNVPDTRESYLLSENIMNTLANTKVIEFRHPFITYLAENNYLRDSEQTLQQQIAEFHYLGTTDDGGKKLSTNLTRELLTSLLPKQYGAEYLIIKDGGETIIHERSADRKDVAKFLLSSKRIVYVAESRTLHGPDIMELRIWS